MVNVTFYYSKSSIVKFVKSAKRFNCLKTSSTLSIKSGVMKKSSGTM